MYDMTINPGLTVGIFVPFSWGVKKLICVKKAIKHEIQNPIHMLPQGSTSQPRLSLAPHLAIPFLHILTAKRKRKCKRKHRHNSFKSIEHDMQQSTSISSQCTDPLRDDERDPTTDPGRDLGLGKGPTKEVTLQLPGVRPRPRQPDVDVAQLRWAHGVPGGGQVVDRTNPKQDTLFGVIPCCVHQADELMEVGMQEDCRKVTDPRFSKCQLSHKGFPTEVYDIDWDVIMVDAPTGYFDGAPGRMTAIYTAGLIARNKDHGDTDVFVHDVDRLVEDNFSNVFLCQSYFREQQGRIRHFNIPSHRPRSARPFCPSS
ncbi:Glucuronoxylan 4-O-methyltransferase 3, partial [Mucuna pruriens]